MVGENTLLDQKSHHRCRRRKHDCRMVDALRWLSQKSVDYEHNGILSCLAYWTDCLTHLPNQYPKYFGEYEKYDDVDQSASVYFDPSVKWCTYDNDFWKGKYVYKNGPTSIRLWLFVLDGYNFSIWVIQIS